MRIKNKKAFFNYKILESLEVGVVLTGAEVKSLRNNRGNLADAFVKKIRGEFWLVNMEIPRYKYDGNPDYDAHRSRKLLLKRKEMVKLESKMKQGRLSLIPISVYLKGRRVKVEIALAKGKKKYEKKNAQKEKDLERELHREKRKYMI
jgi:SsrA-binding protein